MAYRLALGWGLLALSVGLAVSAVEAAPTGRLLSYSIQKGDSSVGLVMQFDRPVRVRSGRLMGTDSPISRVFFDVFARVDRRPKVNINTPWCERVRIGFHDRQRFRIVFDVTSPEVAADAKPSGNAVTFEVRNLRTEKSARPAASATEPHLSQLNREYLDATPSPIPQGGSAMPSPKSPPIPSSGKKWMVVLDPGHGGDECGAVGASGLKEKNVVLRVAKFVRDRLLQFDDIQVVLTRSADVRMSVEERVERANQFDADVFISIHNNAHNDSRVRGIETYFLDNSTDRGTERVVKRENENADREFFKRFHDKQDLEFILTSLSLERKISESKDLAGLVHVEMRRAMADRYAPMPVANNGIKGNLFYVLWGVHSPSALVEIGYISDPTDEELLTQGTVLAAAAYGIANGVRKYIDLKSEKVYTSAKK